MVLIEVSPSEVSIPSNHSCGSLVSMCIKRAFRQVYWCSRISEEYLLMVELLTTEAHRTACKSGNMDTPGGNNNIPVQVVPGTAFTLQNAMVPSQELPKGSGGRRKGTVGSSGGQTTCSKRTTQRDRSSLWLHKTGGQLQVGLIPGACYRWHPATGNGLCGGVGCL